MRTPLGRRRRLCASSAAAIIHRLLELLPAAPPDAAARPRPPVPGAPCTSSTAEAQEEIAREVFRVLEHPEFAPLFGPGSQAEVPLVGELAGARRAVHPVRPDRPAGGVARPRFWSSTTRPTGRRRRREEDVPEIYLRQMAAYRAALLTQIYPGRAVDCALLWTDGPSLMRISPDRLDRHAP